MPGFGRSQAEKSARTLVGIRLASLLNAVRHRAAYRLLVEKMPGLGAPRRKRAPKPYGHWSDPGRVASQCLVTTPEPATVHFDCRSALSLNTVATVSNHRACIEPYRGHACVPSCNPLIDSDLAQQVIREQFFSSALLGGICLSDKHLRPLL